MREVVYQAGACRWTGLRSGSDLQAPPQLLALHGWLDNAASFLPLAEAMPGIDLLALDLPGHGGSSHRGSWYHFVDWISDLHQFLSSRQWPAVTLLGHSLGGLIGCCYGALFPDHLRQLITIEGLGPLTRSDAQTGPCMAEAIRRRTQSGSRYAGAKSRQVTLEKAVRARLARTPMHREHARLILSRNLDPAGCHWRSDPLLNAVSPLRMSEGQAQALCHAMQVPTLLICGQQGEPALRAAIDARRGWFQSLNIVTVPGRHHCHMESPLMVAGEIASFCGLR